MALAIPARGVGTSGRVDIICRAVAAVGAVGTVAAVAPEAQPVARRVGGTPLPPTTY